MEDVTNLSKTSSPLLLQGRFTQNSLQSARVSVTRGTNGIIQKVKFELSDKSWQLIAQGLDSYKRVKGTEASLT